MVRLGEGGKEREEPRQGFLSPGCLGRWSPSRLECFRNTESSFDEITQPECARRHLTSNASLTRSCPRSCHLQTSPLPSEAPAPLCLSPSLSLQAYPFYPIPQMDKFLASQFPFLLKLYVGSFTKCSLNGPENVAAIVLMLHLEKESQS